MAAETEEGAVGSVSHLPCPSKEAWLINGRSTVLKLKNSSTEA